MRSDPFPVNPEGRAKARETQTFRPLAFGAEKIAKRPRA
jgi:hypothetical protein